MSDTPPIPSGRTPLAVLCADVHGYSQLMARNEERTHERVNRSIRLIRLLTADHGGWVANVAGDGLVALFESTSQALQFAFAIQSRLRDEALRDADADPITFRIGINHGEVFLGEGNVQGHSVNVAARIQALARPGGICVTAVVQRAARDGVGRTVRPLGLKYLKNIDEPVEVFAIDINGAEAVPSLPLTTSLRSSYPAVAVEPFQALSRSQDETYLALAISESLVQALSKFKWLTVKEDRTSGLVTPVLAGIPTGSPDEVGYVVAGQVLRMQGGLRLVAKLRDHPGGRIIWSSTSDLRAGRTFKRLDELAAVLAARLDRQVLMAEVAEAWQKPPEDLDAQGYVMRALPLMFQMSKGSLHEAEQLLRVADEGQPRSSRSRALRAFAALLRIGQQWASDPRAAEEEIDWLTRSAIEYAPSDPIALSLRGHVEVLHLPPLRRRARLLSSAPSKAIRTSRSAGHSARLRCRTSVGRTRRYADSIAIGSYVRKTLTPSTSTRRSACRMRSRVSTARRSRSGGARSPRIQTTSRPTVR